MLVLLCDVKSVEFAGIERMQVPSLFCRSLEVIHVLEFTAFLDNSERGTGFKP